jgi:preprotein translocase subunit YajC
MIGLMFVVFYLLLIRPQQKKAKEHQNMIDSLKKGTEIITSGGLVGRITGESGKTLTVEIADKVRVRVLRSQVAGVYSAADNAEKK